MVTLASDTLLHGGTVYYLARNTFGIAALVDASECAPTYNARFDDVRAYMAGGYATLSNAEGDMSQRGEIYQMDWVDFEQRKLSHLGVHDLVIVLEGVWDMSAAEAKTLSTVVAAARRVSCKTALVTINSSAKPLSLPVKLENSAWSARHDVLLPQTSFELAGDYGLYFLAELSAKLVLNAITTGAHVLKGKVGFLSFFKKKKKSFT